MTTLNMWNKEGMIVLQKARGTYAPYRIRNRTGGSILVWSDADAGIHAAEAETTPISNDQMIDWRFDDWRATREVFTTLQHKISAFLSFLPPAPHIGRGAYPRPPICQ